MTDKDVDSTNLTFVKNEMEDDGKTPSLSNCESDETFDISKIKDGEEGYVVMDLHDKNDIKELDKTFNTMIEALRQQRYKLAAKWELINAKKNKKKKKKKKKGGDLSEEEEEEEVEDSLLIDLKHMLERIERIGMIRGRKFEELESEQNKAIEKLTTVVDLEEEARICRNKAIEIQKETELEMKEIDAQREVISKELKKAEPDLIAARLAVEDINDRALNELISLKKPPPTVVNVLTVAVWIVNSVDVSSSSSSGSSTNTKGPTTVALKSAASDTTSLSSTGTRRGRTRTAESAETAKLRRLEMNSFSLSTGLRSSSLRSSSTPRARKSGKASKTSKIAKTPKTPRAKSKSKAKRDRASSSALNLNLYQDLASPRRSRTPSNEFSNNDSALSLTPLSESESQIKKRSKSKIISRSPRKNKGNKGNSAAATPKTPKHSKKGSRIDKLKSRNFEKILTQPWSDTRVMLTRGNFKKSVLSFDPKQLPKKVCKRIETDYLILEDFTVLRANQASKVLGPLVKWIQSLIGYTKIWYAIEPMAIKVAELERALGVKTLEVKRLKSISTESHAKVIQIRSEMLKMVGYHKIGELYFLS